MKHAFNIFLTSLLLAPLAVLEADAEHIETDLLIVSGNESACAAAVQVVRLGVKRIVLVNDIEWLGGQFSTESVGPLDGRTIVGGKSVNFPRSGLFLEMVERIRAHNIRTYGVPAPGNCWSGTETIEPAAAACLFQTNNGRWTPASSRSEGRTV